MAAAAVILRLFQKKVIKMGKGLTGGRLYGRKETALYVDNGVIERIGTDEEIISMLKEADEHISLNGSLVCPGLCAVDVHLAEEGMKALAADLSGAKESTEVLRRLKETDPPFESCLAGKGLDMALVCQELKQQADGDRRRIILFCDDPEYCFLNKAAEADLDARRTEGAYYDEETGLLHAGKGNSAGRSAGRWSARDLEKMILAAASRYRSEGFTSLLSDDLGMGGRYEDVLDAFMRLDHQEKLPLRVSELCRFETAEELARFLDEGYTEGVGEGRFRIGKLRTGVLDEEGLIQVKLANMYNMGAFMDGVLEDIDPEEAVYPGNPLGSAFVSDSLSPYEEAFLKQACLKRCMSAKAADESCDALCRSAAGLFPAGAKLSREELLQRCISASALDEWDDTGRLEEGMVADLTVLRDGKAELVLVDGVEAV